MARGALLRLSVWWVGPDPALGVHQKKVATVKTRRSHPSSELDTTLQEGELPCHGKGVVSKKIEEIVIGFFCKKRIMGKVFTCRLGPEVNFLDGS